MSDMPTVINASRTITFNVNQIINDISEEQDKPRESVTIEEVMERVEEWADEQLNSPYTQNYYLDESGQDISYYYADSKVGN